MSAAQENSDNLCVVCFKTVDIYSVGECDHPVCHECSTRMRVLCLQTECPICRNDLSKVIFSATCQPYKVINAQPFRSTMFERKHKICFADERVREIYDKLLEHNCGRCAASFRNFALLKEHLRKEHDLFYCDLCVDNLKIFTIERKCYTKSQLALHRRKGDPDDTSHKGHPLCEFCDARYMDTDELFRHLRKEHLYCHLCDADGFHHYYGSYKALKDHFRRDHFLCEEGECGEQNLTGVFRSEIDLKAHKASEHGRGLSKQAARQARMLEVQFTLTPRPARGPPPPHARTQERVEPEPTMYDPPVEEMPVMYAGPSIDTHSTEQFPTLGGAPGPSLSLLRGAPPPRLGAAALQRTLENFPSLGDAEPPPSFRVNITHQHQHQHQAPQQPGPSNAIIKTAKPSVSIQVHNRAPASSRYHVTETSNKQLAMRLADKEQLQETSKRFQDEFPSLNKRDKALLMNDYSSFGPPVTNSAPKKPAVVVQPKPAAPVVRAPPPSMDAFPALGPSGSGPPAADQPKWITAKPATPKPKPTKVSPAPSIAQTLNSSSDFPTLKVNKQKNKQPERANSFPPQRSEGSSEKEVTKKDKKKNKTMVEWPPASAPPDLNSRDKKNDKENTRSGNDAPKKKEKQLVNNDAKEKKKNVQNNNEKLGDKSNNNNISESVPKPSSADAQKKVQLVNNSEKEFPSLGGVQAQVQVQEYKTTKSKSVPPGFSKRAVPPGFTAAVPACNGFTFTSSSGQSYSIPVHNYVQPSNFNQRNKSLVSNFMKVMECQTSIHEFKQFSQMFREGTYSAESYYEHCRKAMGKEFKTIFPELLTLLPDIRKQQELHKLYTADKKSPLEICSTCGQVLCSSDVKSHEESHQLQDNFPALGAPSAHGATTWRK